MNIGSIPLGIVAFAVCQALTAGAAHADWPTEADPPPPIEQGGYELVWADEFDKDGVPNPANWDYEHGFVRNNELQWYQPQNAMVDNGLLTIQAVRERRANPDYHVGSRSWATQRKSAEYTSASVITQGKREWLYGRFVMRAKIPTAPGMWPAFWTLGDGSWPRCGEIDVMEYYRGMVLANAAWQGEDRLVAWDAVRVPIDQLGDASWSDEFHLWRVDWTAARIDIYVDDRLINSIDSTVADGGGHEGKNPFRQPHYLLVNLAVGGQNGGDPSGVEMPAKYVIDFIRVYQRQDDGVIPKSSHRQSLSPTEVAARAD
ncbi:glycoside hydrolase family 16 protein [Botrimarina mediterranea]|uniref:Beta-glucanase n=1 Tax=Botrimarina mediterranea TaxID=2528022 RepID=A0A518KA69_9BACT|nr:glycoside hydrolase family 16 protein [Botrimarina mediterranea]QDV74680.1 Beta-glucanase precursor [Botrimarina mediterranea]QDV79316.1 Beta-glucanase precursor [Planctomycetes bacterium K2D]